MQIEFKNLKRAVPVYLAALFLVGCSKEPIEESDVPESSGDSTSAASVEPSATAPDKPKPKRSFSAITLGDEQGGGSATSKASSLKASTEDVIAKLKPLQVLLGQWRGTTRREYEGFKAVDQHEWIWDLRTEPTRPALVMTSDKSPYLRNARMTWLTDEQEYQLTTNTPEAGERVYTGTFTKEIEDVAGDDGKLQRTFRLEFTQVVDGTAKEAWKLAFNQQENNRYLLELERRRGKAAFRRYDTVSTQRDGTSFAISDSDYGEKTCIISQGLGTISVSYQGKTYWVCCTGCKAAFEEEPERWIKRAAEEAMKK